MSINYQKVLEETHNPPMVKVTVLSLLWVLRGIKLWLNHWDFRNSFPVASGHKLLPGKVVGYIKLNYVPYGIALLMKQEPDPRMLGVEPDVMDKD